MTNSAPLKFPSSKSTVRVRMVDTTTLMTIKAEYFINPTPPGHELINIVDVAFLVENDNLCQKVMFDLGCRKDYQNLPPSIQKRFGNVIPSIRVDKDVSEILQDQSVALKSIDSVIWSHYHWDHTSDVSLFPPSTSLIVGPGFKSEPGLLPGYPDLPDSPVSASDFANRTLIEIDFSSNNLKIGSFPAHDFFGDGSFYLLDAPGHCTGHICGLARTTTNPDTFVFMGGDICHFAGDFRPNKTYPLPDPIPSEAITHSLHRNAFPVPCPCSIFTDRHPRTRDLAEARVNPWYDLADPAYTDAPTARKSVKQMTAFDESEDVLVCIAHDPTLLQVLPTLNESPEQDLNSWKANGWKEKCHWGWINELPSAEGKPGRPKIIDGFWRDGKPWDRTEGQSKM